MQQQPKQLVFAQGIEAAKAVQMNPGDTVPIFDTERPVLYVRSVDGAGVPQEMLMYDLVPHVEKQTEYVTKDEFAELKTMIQEALGNGKPAV